MAEVTEVYSYHTFLFPFIWENGKLSYTKKKITEGLDKSKYWENSDFNIKQPGDLDIKEHISFYSQYQYVHPEVREAIFGMGKNIVANYRICPKYLKRPPIENEKMGKNAECEDRAVYKITKYVEITKEDHSAEYEKTEYILVITNIFLKLFNTGVAILGLECENYEHKSFEDVLMINDYGRRIQLPFIPTINKAEDEVYYWASSICADELEITLLEENGQSNHIKTSFAETIKAFNNPDKAFDSVRKDTYCYISECITGLLELETDLKFTMTDSGSKNEIAIYPGLDERMYVMSLIRDTENNKDLLGDIWKEAGQETEMECQTKQREKLYKFTFVDAKDCTCQSDKMRDELLQKYAYDRWIKYETRYMIAPQACNAICNDANTIYTFRTLYMQMVILTLVQRTSLLNFQLLAQKHSEKLNCEKLGRWINMRSNLELMELQERFIAYQNQLNFAEISSQEQAVDIYEMLKKANFISELKESISEQFDFLYGVAGTKQDVMINTWALLLAIISLVPLEKMAELCGVPNFVGILVSFLVVGLIIYITGSWAIFRSGRKK